MKREGCQHARGEHCDDYRHCLDCGMEWVRIGVEWFPVEGWVRLDVRFLADEAKEGSDVR